MLTDSHKINEVGRDIRRIKSQTTGLRRQNLSNPESLPHLTPYSD